LVLHQALARLIEDIGRPHFWRSLVQALRQLAMPDNVLGGGHAHRCAAASAGGAWTLEQPLPSESPVPRYCGGM